VLADPDRSMPCMTPLLLVVLLALPAAGVAQPRERVDSSQPSLDPVPRGDRVLGTRGQRLRSEAQLREELIRQNELERLFNPHRGAGDGLGPVVPWVRLPPGPCAGRGCPPPVPFVEPSAMPRR